MEEVDTILAIVKVYRIQELICLVLTKGEVDTILTIVKFTVPSSYNALSWVK